jgi:flagellar biosynthesis/type III secretory pathway chaperone
LEEEKKLQSSIDQSLTQLEKLEKNRSQLFSLLKERGALDRIESTYERLVNEKTLLERNTSIVREIDEIEEILGKLQYCNS